MYTSPCSQTMFSMVYFQKWNCQLVHTIYRLLPLSAIAKLASRVTPTCIIGHALEMPFPYIITNTRYYQSFKVLLVRQGAKCVFICIFLITDGAKYFSYIFFAIQVLSSIHCLTMSLLFFPLYYLYFLVDRSYRKTYYFLDRKTQCEKDTSFKLFNKWNAIPIKKKNNIGFLFRSQINEF